MTDTLAKARRSKKAAGTSAAARALKAVATAEETRQPAPPPSQPKQAVLVIHGMGEQTPMETLRGFVHSVWETDLSLTDRMSAEKDVRREEKGVTLNKSWIVPDTRTGSLELARITTAEADFGARTDFFEFYWADIMQGTTLDHLKAWIMGLLFRWPHQVPRGVFAAWLILWTLVIVAVAAAVVGVLGFTDNLGLWSTEDSDWPEAVGRIMVAGGFLALLAFLTGKLRSDPRATATSWFFALAVPLALSLAISTWMPWDVLFSPSVVAILFSAVLGYALQAFLLPYFGDVARYVRAAPETIAKRAEVRERGLALLRRLHGQPKTGPALERYDFGEEDERYERIIVVAHSLGSVIAYDLLCHFWAEVGPTRNNAPNKAQLDALKAVDDYIRETDPHGASVKNRPAFDLVKFRKLQRAASRALGSAALSPNGWRITDFVTVGSPLTHADFLISRDRSRLQTLIEERRLSVCPPAPDGGEPGFLYPPIVRKGNDPRKLAHHASAFAVTRWTNIYDPHALAFGDLISGSLKSNFHLGIEEHAVRMRRRFLGIPRTRVFTHTHYWSMEADGKAEGGVKRSGELANKDHIALLRDAVALADAPVIEKGIVV